MQFYYQYHPAVKPPRANKRRTSTSNLLIPFPALGASTISIISTVFQLTLVGLGGSAMGPARARARARSRTRAGDRAGARARARVWARARARAGACTRARGRRRWLGLGREIQENARALNDVVVFKVAFVFHDFSVEEKSLVGNRETVVSLELFLYLEDGREEPDFFFKASAVGGVNYDVHC